MTLSARVVVDLNLINAVLAIQVLIINISLVENVSPLVSLDNKLIIINSAKSVA